MPRNNFNPAIHSMESSFKIRDSEEYTLPKILIVDDEPRVLRSLRAALRFKFDVTTAQSAFQAQEIMQDSERFDVIVSDERMPKYSGHNFLEWAKDNHPYCVRIMLTSSDFSTLRESLDSAEIYKYLSKPWNMKELENVLEKAVLKSQALVSRALKEPLPGLYPQCIVGVLDPDTNYHESYLKLGQEIEGVSDTYFFDTTNEMIASISQIEGIGILMVDLAFGVTETTRLIREVNQKYPSVSIFVTAKPAPLASFISYIGTSLDYQYITKPMSPERIQPLMLTAVERYIL